MLGCSRFGFSGALGGYHLFMMIPMLIILFLIGYLIYKSLNVNTSSNFGDGSSTKAISILKERLAKGEITEEEYESIKKQII